MRKVMLKIHISLDGYIEAADGDHESWVFRTYDEELQAWEVDMLWQAGTHIMGRKLYEQMAAHWPTSTEAFAQPMNEVPKVIFSRTLKQTDWVNSRLATGDVGEEIARLKQEPGKDILVHGGAGFVQSLAARGLIDEYRLVMHPVVLAGGLPLFAQTMDLQRLQVKAFPSGAMALTYARV